MKTYAEFLDKLPDDPSLEDLEKIKILAEIAKFDEETRGFELNNEARAIELEYHKLRGPQNYIFTLYGPIGGDSADECVQTLDQWRRKAPDGTEFTIMLNSPGGNINDGFALHDFIKSVQNTNPVKVKVFGMAASMAAVVLQSATTRAIQPNASLMLHQSQLTARNLQMSSSALEDQSRRTTELQDRLYGIVADRSGLRKGDIKRRCNLKNEWWIDAEEALAKNLVDVIEY